MAGIEMISYTSGPTLGNVEAGVAAALMGLRGSIVFGGVMCLVGCAVVARSFPGFWSYDSRAP